MNMEKKIRIGFVTSADPLDKRSWSGIHYQMFASLQKEFDVIALGPVDMPRSIDAMLHYLNKLHQFLFKKRYNHRHNILRSKYYNHAFLKKIRNQNIDILFAPAASTEIAFLKTNIPVIHLSDTSFNQIKNYYSGFSEISDLSIRESNFIEKRAIKNAALQIYSSEWASDYVITYYKANPESVFVVKFGSNIDNPPGNDEIIKDYSGTIQLLFLGVNWIRKGGDIAIEAFKILLQRGYDVELIVCGCTPPEEHPKVTVIDFLDKNTEADSEKFKQVLLNTHLLLLPTRADCTPLVFGEVNAFGIPAITTNTGGVASVIENDVNGYALPFESSHVTYADKIQELIDNKEKLGQLAVTSRRKYENELNWNVWKDKIKAIILLHLMKSDEENTL